MILCRSPLRISFFGGGTDFEYFIKNQHYGQVFSCTINKYVYLLLKKTKNQNFKLSYSKTENATNYNEIKHNYFREALNLYKINYGLEISTHADIKSGLGLSSSSAFGSTLLMTLEFLKKNKIMNRDQLWKKTYFFEKNLIKNYCGVQDQFIISHGGLRLTKFYNNLKFKSILLHKSNDLNNFFKKNLLLINTRVNRNYNAVMHDQKMQYKNNIKNLILMRGMAAEGYQLLKKRKYYNFGKLLDENWKLKKTLSKEIFKSKKLVDLESYLYNQKIWGLKLLGTGGGGMLLVCGPEKVIKKLKNYKKIDSFEIQLTYEPTKIVYFE